MEKRFDDEEEFKKFLEEQYIQEAELLAAELLADDDLEEDEMSDAEVEASYEKLKAKLINDGVYREDEDSHNPTLEKKNIHSVRNKYSEESKTIPIQTIKRKGFEKTGKVAGIAVVSALCVFAASMTSQANREYFIYKVGVLTGNHSRLMIENDASNELIYKDSDIAWMEISKELDIEVPKLLYQPKDFRYVAYSMDKSAHLAKVQYDYKGSIISLRIDDERYNKSSNRQSITGELVDVLDINKEGVMVEIMRTQDDDDLEPSYTAWWEKDNVLYQLSGKINITVLQNILEKMKY